MNDRKGLGGLHADTKTARQFRAFFPSVFQECSEKLAVCDDLVCLTYAQFDHVTRQLALRFGGRVNATRPTFAIYADRSVGLVVSMLACFRAGIPFAVLDSSYPAAKVVAMLEDIQPSCVVDTTAGFPAIAKDTAASGYTILSLSTADIRDLSIPTEVEDRSPVASPPSDEEESLAYFLFTSGTTGRSKCIKNGSLPLLHFIEWYVRTFRPTSADRFSMLSGLSHDPLLRDIFVPLRVGASIHIPPNRSVRDPGGIRAWIRKREISFMHLTPQLLRIINSQAELEAPLPSLRHVFTGGDSIRLSDARAFQRAAGNAKLINFYGSTETPQAMATYPIDPESDTDPIPIGKAIDDVQLLVLDEELNEVPVGVNGQICVATKFLSRGYLGADAGSRSFIPCLPSTRDTQTPAYLTGDYGIRRADGNVVLKGRNDDQIKIRGFRVELGEITNALAGIPSIKDAFVVPRTAGTGETVLVAFLVPRDKARPQTALEADVVSRLSSELPAYMVPARFLWLDELPLLPNEKTDRQSLLETLDAADQLLNSQGEDEDRDGRDLLKEFKRILGNPSASPKQSFVDLGGDSLSFVHASIAVEKALGWLPPGWERMSLGELLKQERRSRGSWIALETPLVLRALAICLVVVSHTHVVLFTATSLLFVISGISFGRFLRPSLLASGNPVAIFRFISKFGIPAALWQIVRPLATGRFWLPDLILMGAMWQEPNHPRLGFWFLDILAANILILTGLALAEYWLVRRKVVPPRQGNARFMVDLAWCVLGLLISFAQVSTGWWDGEVGEASVGPFKWFWLLCLGVALSQAGNVRHKIALSAFVVSVAAIHLAHFSTLEGSFRQIDMTFYLPVAAVIWLGRVPVPRFLKGVIVPIASASLFIYIVNWSVIAHVLPRLHLPAWWPLQTAAGVAAGIGAYRGWEFLTSMLMGRLRRIRMATKERATNE